MNILKGYIFDLIPKNPYFYNIIGSAKNSKSKLNKNFEV